MKASFRHPSVEPFGVAPPPPSFTGDTTAEEPIDPATDAAANDVPPPSTSDDFDIRRTLENVITIQVAHGQLLVDMLDELCALQADLAS